jgi:SPP1 gp7 family putative phage head morphogenesis protein
MADVYDIAAEHRRQVLAGDTAAAAQLLAAYAEALDRVEALVNDLLAAIGDERPTEGQLVRLAQYGDVLEAIAAEMAALADLAGDVTAQQQAQGYATGAQQAQAQVTALLPDDWERALLPAATEATAAIVGFAGDGTPLSELLGASGKDVADKARDVLLSGIASGQSARDIAQALQDVWGQGLARAMATARTETMRAYREGNRNAYLANSDVISAWEWVATKSSRTCPACLAMDGKIFPLHQPMPAHVNCRCTCAPVVKGRASSDRKTGTAWLDDQDEATQRKVLGTQGLAAYLAGATLDQFLQYRHDPVWGKQALWAVPK